MVVQPIVVKGCFFTFKLGNDGLPNTSFFAGILFDSNDVIGNLVNNKALINVDATKTTEVVGGDGGSFIQDAKE